MKFYDHAPKTVALVGMGPSISDFFTELLTQEAQPSFADEIWAINMAANVIWHDVVIWMDDLDAQENFKPGLFKLLRRRGKPVITSKRYPDVVPNSYDYPIDEVSRIAVPILGKPYLNNGVAMAIAYALWKGVKTFKMYGCDFTYPNRNYAESGRACVEAWIALASMKGMQIELCRSTSIMDTVDDKGVYGYAVQPDIDLGGGQTFKYQTAAAPAPYAPEDSRNEGESDEFQGSIPGAGDSGAGDGGPISVEPQSANGATPPAVG